MILGLNIFSVGNIGALSGKGCLGVLVEMLVLVTVGALIQYDLQHPQYTWYYSVNVFLLGQVLGI